MVLHSNNLSEVKNFLRDNIDIELSLRREGASLRSQRKLQHLFAKKFNDSKNQKLLEIVLTYAERAERTCPGAGIKTIKRFLGYSQDDYTDESLKTRADVVNALSNAYLSNKTLSIFKEILDYCGSGVRIKLKKSINSKTFIEVTNSYHFKVDSLIKHKNFATKEAKSIVIDGYIENVSELHHIFEYFSTKESETPFAIFCRGMSDDVLSTISINNSRGALNCYAFKANFDLEGVNTLADIAVVTGTDVVSSLKGDLISSIKVESLKSFDSLTVVKDGVLIKNLKTYNQVQLHVSNLRKKAEQPDQEIQKEYLFTRIRSLSANCIDIALPDDINFFSFSQEIDEAIRIITSAFDKTYLVEETVNEYSKKLSKVLCEIGAFV